jgi:thymidylate synthase (FAD)
MSELRLITEPGVYVVGRPSFAYAGLDAYFADRHAGCKLERGYHDDAVSAGDAMPEVAGRMCYQSFTNPRPGGNAAYLDHIKSVGHGSVLEHSVWNFIITGVSRSLSHELIRHRAGIGVSELSQRYVDCSDVAFVIPPALLKYHRDWCENCGGISAEALDLALPFSEWLGGRVDSLAEYAQWTDRLVKDAPADLPATERRKWARQAARSVLPECTETQLFWTANARALRHFIEMRASRHADQEIRRLAVCVLRLMQSEAPHLFSDYTLTELGPGDWEATTPHRKV